jgi:hypothetical protein
LCVIVSMQTNGLTVVFRVIHYFFNLTGYLSYPFFHFSPATIFISSSVRS